MVGFYFSDKTYYNHSRDSRRKDSRYTNTTSTTSESFEDVTITGCNNWTSVTIVYIKDKTDEDLKKIKELLQKDKILKMKKTWNTFKKEFYSTPPIRPEVQLRGVCFSGRGWA